MHENDVIFFLSLGTVFGNLEVWNVNAIQKIDLVETEASIHWHTHILSEFFSFIDIPDI